MNDYKAIFFDAGGTLIYPYPSVGEVYSRIAKKYGYKVESEKLEKNFYMVCYKREKYRKKDNRSSLEIEYQWWFDCVKEIFFRSGLEKEKTETQKFKIFFQKLYLEFAKASRWRLYKDVIPALEFLRKKYKLSIVSNWDWRLFKILQDKNLSQFFNHIIVSAIEGYLKPHPKIYLIAKQKLNLENSNDILFIGDRLSEDYYGPRKVGFDSLIIDRFNFLQKKPKIETLHQLLNKKNLKEFYLKNLA